MYHSSHPSCRWLIEIRTLSHLQDLQHPCSLARLVLNTRAMADAVASTCCPVALAPSLGDFQQPSGHFTCEIAASPSDREFRAFTQGKGVPCSLLPLSKTLSPDDGDTMVDFAAVFVSPPPQFRTMWCNILNLFLVSADAIPQRPRLLV